MLETGEVQKEGGRWRQGKVNTKEREEGKMTVRMPAKATVLLTIGLKITLIHVILSVSMHL